MYIQSNGDHIFNITFNGSVVDKTEYVVEFLQLVEESNSRANSEKGVSTKEAHLRLLRATVVLGKRSD